MVGMTGEIKAIQTRYKGYHFRSRLEARWAVFFDALGIKWEYEKEGYDLGEHGWYLPDFWLPSFSIRGELKRDVFIEIKGSFPTQEEQDRCSHLAMKIHGSVFIFMGVPDCEDGEGGLQFIYNPRGIDCNDGHIVIKEFVWEDNDMHFYQCKKCNNIKIEFREGNYMTCSCNNERNSYSDVTPELSNAYMASRSARFEHGECGPT